MPQNRPAYGSGPGMTDRRRTSRLNALRRELYGRHFTVSARTFHLLVNAWGLVIGALCVFTSLLFFTAPDSLLSDTSIGTQLGALDVVWNALYGVSGALILTGLILNRKGLDAFGLVMLATTTIINFLAIVATLGPRGLIVAPQLIGVTAAAVARVLVVTEVIHVRIERP